MKQQLLKVLCIIFSCVFTMSSMQIAKAANAQQPESLDNKIKEIQSVIKPGNKEYIDSIGGFYLENNKIVVLTTKKIALLARYENDQDIKILTCKYSYKELAASLQEMHSAIIASGVGVCGLDASDTPGLYAFGIDERENKIKFSMRNINLSMLKEKLREENINMDILSLDVLFTGTIANRKAGLYKLPDTNSKTITNLKKTYAIAVKPFNKEWVELVWEGETVYLKLNAIKVIYREELLSSMSQPEPEISIPNQGLASTSSSINIRSGPSTSYKKIGKLLKGETVNIVGTDGYWVKIDWRNSDIDAYVHASYLEY